MKYIFTFLILINLVSFSYSQNIGIGTVNPQAKLDIQSSNSGLLIPRVALGATNGSYPVTDVSIGECVFNTGSSGSGDFAVSEGFYYWSGNLWVRLKSGTSEDRHNWYEEGTTTPPNSINDNIYTNGNVGVGESNPSERLSIYVDDNVSAEIGKAHVGHVGHNDWAGFSHIDVNNTTDYALRQGDSGETILNSAEGQNILIKNNNSTKSVFEADGDFGVGTDEPSSKMEVVGDIRINGNDAGIIYENVATNKDWRLVFVDNFNTTSEDWVGISSNGSGGTGYFFVSSGNDAIGNYIRPTNNNYVLKKYFDLSGITFSEVKVEFNYLFLDSWDTESGWLGVKSSANGTPTPIWYKQHNNSWANMELNGSTSVSSFYGNSQYSDSKIKGKSFFSWDSSSFWLEFGANLNGLISDETFGIDNIFIYVR